MKKINLYINVLILINFNFIYPINNQEKMYFCTAADSDFVPWLLNLIGSIHKVNFKETGQIAVFDLGLSQADKNLLNSIRKVKVYDLEVTHPDLFKHFVIRGNGKKARGWYAWKPIAIKQALQKFPRVLYLDAGCAILNPLNSLFNYIKNNHYFIVERSGERKHESNDVINGWNIKFHCTKYVKQKFIDPAKNKQKILNSPIVVAGVMGLDRTMLRQFVIPIYELTKDFRNFQDDGSCINGFGHSLHDQTIFSIYAYLLNLKLLPAHKKVIAKDLNICVSKYIDNNPDIYWHCKGKLEFKKYIKFRKRNEEL